MTNQSIGYMDAPVPKDLDLKEAIDKLRKEKNAIILAHYYQTGDIQDIADYVGDSLALAQWAAKTKADIIVLCGVHFMGETAKILCPDASLEEQRAQAEVYQNLQESAASAAARGYVDTVIAPEDTRKYVIGALEMLFTKREDHPVKKHGTMVMWYIAWILRLRHTCFVIPTSQI